MAIVPSLSYFDDMITRCCKSIACSGFQGYDECVGRVLGSGTDCSYPRIGSSLPRRKLHLSCLSEISMQCQIGPLSWKSQRPLAVSSARDSMLDQTDGLLALLLHCTVRRGHPGQRIIGGPQDLGQFPHGATVFLTIDRQERVLVSLLTNSITPSSLPNT